MVVTLSALVAVWCAISVPVGLALAWLARQDLGAASALPAARPLAAPATGWSLGRGRQ